VAAGGSSLQSNAAQTDEPRTALVLEGAARSLPLPMTFARHYDAATEPRGVLRHLLPLAGYPSLVWHNRYMVYNFLRRDLLGRVHGSFLGLYWLLLQPMFLFAIYFFVFGLVFNAGPDASYALYLFSGVIVFHSLIEATSQSCAVVVDNGNLVKKVAFPSEVLPIHIALVSLVTYSVGAVVCLVSGLLLGVVQPGWLLLALPLVLAVQFVFSVGMGLLLANLNVFVRDVAHLWRIVVVAWQFLSPVFWRPDLLLGKVADGKVPAFVFTLLETGNPAYPLLMAHRLALGGVDPQLGDFWSHLGVAAAWAGALLVLGYSTFTSSKHKFADLI
jgi:ABC-type polysaccharide/polyol phosphate export permease